MQTIQIISPIDGCIVAERELASEVEIDQTLDRASEAQRAWKKTPLSERAAFCRLAIDALVAHKDELAEELTVLMGRPIRYSPGEIKGLAERGRHMISIAEQALSDIVLPEEAGLSRFIRKEALGVVFVIAPWNYPYLTAVNVIIPALMAGNTVLLKHAPQTLLVAERFQAAFEAAALPPGIFQSLHLSDEHCRKVVEDKRVHHVAFTGSVETGRVIEKSSAGLLKSLSLELGGKDPAYVCADANLPKTVSALVDGAYFNSGQSCCAVERIYVVEALYDDFVEAFVSEVKSYCLDSPLLPETTLGPLVSVSAAERVKRQVAAAVKEGARSCIDPSHFKGAAEDTAYMAPQVLVNVDHRMGLMCEESFGPVVGIMKVSDDEEALRLMNDSSYGLTASIWTEDLDRVLRLGDQIETGTVFMNRCDFLDPALPWVGVKASGRGCTLSELGYSQLTRPKSFYLKRDI